MCEYNNELSMGGSHQIQSHYLTVVFCGIILLLLYCSQLCINSQYVTCDVVCTVIHARAVTYGGHSSSLHHRSCT